MITIRHLQGLLIAFCAAVLLALGGGLWAWKASRDLTSARSEVHRLAAENYTLAKGLEAGDKASQTQAKGYKAVGEETSKRQEKLEKAIERNPDWANEPIPNDVLDSLR